MAVGRESYSDTYWESKEVHCSIAVPVDQDIMGTDLSRNGSLSI